MGRHGIIERFDRLVTYIVSICGKLGFLVFFVFLVSSSFFFLSWTIWDRWKFCQSIYPRYIVMRIMCDLGGGGGGVVVVTWVVVAVRAGRTNNR